eukprot:14801500-Alexandrium_andersonii.AAC.1
MRARGAHQRAFKGLKKQPEVARTRVGALLSGVGPQELGVGRGPKVQARGPAKHLLGRPPRATAGLRFGLGHLDNSTRTTAHLA